MNRLLLAAMIVLATSTSRAEPPTIDDTASVRAPSLPPAKSGGRELQRVFAGVAGEVFLAETEAEWRDLHAFRDIVPGGTWVLAVTMTSAHREFDDLSSLHATSSPLKVTLSATCAWQRDGKTVVEAPITVEHSSSVDHALTKDDLRTEWRRLFRELGQRAFSELYESEFRGDPGAGVR